MVDHASPDQVRPPARPPTVDARGAEGVQVGDHNTQHNNVNITVHKVIDDTLRTALQDTSRSLDLANRRVEQLGAREADLLRQVEEAARERDRLRAELARVRGQLDESRAHAQHLRQQLVEQVAELTRRCGEVEHLVEEKAAELASVRARLKQELEQRDALRPRRAALAESRPYVGELARRDRTLTRDVGAALLAMAAGSVAFLLAVNFTFAAFDLVAAPLAGAVIVGEALYRQRWTAALTLMIPTLVASWLAILVQPSSGTSGDVPFGDAVSGLTVGCSLVVLVVVVAGYRRRERGVANESSRARRAGARGLLTVAAVMPVAAVGTAFAGTAYAGWIYAPSLVAFTGVVAQTTWEHDLRARRAGAVAALVYAAVETIAAVNHLAPGTVFPQTHADGSAVAEVSTPVLVAALVLFAVLAVAALVALGMTIKRTGRATS